MDRSSTSTRQRSIMIVSESDSFADVISKAFPTEENTKITTKNESFKAMNGHAVDLAFDHDVVIFEADPDNRTEVQAIETLLAHRADGTVFLAMTDNDVSIVKARQLREIGIDEVLPISIDSDGLRAVVEEQIGARRTPQKEFHDGPSAHGQLFVVGQSRGGAGATTVATNLAYSLANGPKSLFRKGEQSRVVLLDFDIQFGNSNVFLDLEDKGGFLQIIEANEEPDDHFLMSTLQTHPLGFDVLCAPTPVIPLQSVRPDLIENMLDLLRDRYDYIIVDLPRAIVDWVEPVLKRAASLILVTDISVPCVRQSRRLIDFYRETNVGLPIEVVVNRDRRPLIKSEHVREVENVLETRLNHWLPDNTKVARSAVDLGRPVVEMKPKSDLGKALINLGTALSTQTSAKKSKKT